MAVSDLEHLRIKLIYNMHYSNVMNCYKSHKGRFLTLCSTTHSSANPPSNVTPSTLSPWKKYIYSINNYILLIKHSSKIEKRTSKIKIILIEGMVMVYSSTMLKFIKYQYFFPLKGEKSWEFSQNYVTELWHLQDWRDKEQRGSMRI